MPVLPCLLRIGVADLLVVVEQLVGRAVAQDKPMLEL